MCSYGNNTCWCCSSDEFVVNLAVNAREDFDQAVLSIYQRLSPRSRVEDIQGTFRESAHTPTTLVIHHTLIVMASSQIKQSLDYLVCSDCGEPAFAWLTAVFCCPVCGCDTFDDPEGSEEDEAEISSADAHNNIDGDREEELRPNRKRKRED